MHSLRQAIIAIKPLLSDATHYKIIARGPLAGIIALKSATHFCTHLTIQARGLLAEEYRYTHKNSSKLKAFLYALRTYQLRTIEKQAYTSTHRTIPTTIEVVSTALGTYLHESFGAPYASIAIATQDIPLPISPDIRANHRKEIRTLHRISDTTHVYVYNGSAKTWQCPQETILFFKKIYEKNADSFLFIVTQDIGPFIKLISEQQLPPQCYKIISLPFDKVMPYLCASDTGLLFRESDCINWVSRPTKLLEYQVAGLSIVHNNTIALLAHNQNQKIK